MKTNNITKGNKGKDERRWEGADKIFLRLEHSQESTERGYSDSEILDLGVERLAKPWPGKNVRSKDKVPRHVVKRAETLISEGCMTEENVEELFFEYKQRLNSSPVYDYESAKSFADYLVERAPSAVSKLKHVDLTFIGRIYVEWTALNCQYADAQRNSSGAGESLRMNYRNSTKSLENSISDFKKVHGLEVKVLRTLEFRFQKLRKDKGPYKG
ncbi:MAG: hypothetical protein U9R08_00345 [Nanoarchaeota archaeon]|nr:hypothetical protein [Nanoarchaeota archaeon]